MEPELGGHEACQGTVDTLTSAELVEVASCLCQDQLTGHGERESVEKHHQFVDAHMLLHGSLSVYRHDGDADKQVKGGGLVVGPASFPHGESIFLREFSLEADEEPAVAEHEGETALRGLQVRVEPWEQLLDEHPQRLLEG